MSDEKLRRMDKHMDDNGIEDVLETFLTEMYYI